MLLALLVRVERRGLLRTLIVENLGRGLIFAVFLRDRLATRATVYRSLRALRARNPETVSERVFWGVCNATKKETLSETLLGFRAQRARRLL